MTHLKKMFFALAVALGLGLLGTSSALAQTVNCTAFSVPTLIRSQGLAEVTGTITLSCGATTIPVSSASITVTITPPTAVVTNDLGAGKQPTAQLFNGGTVTLGTVTFSGNTVTIPITGTAGTSVIQTLQIANIRVNANASGVVFPAQIAALVTASPANAISISNNQLNVAIPQNGLVPTFSAGAGLAQCSSATFAGAADAPGTLTITAITGTATNFVTTTTTLAGKTISGGTTAKVTLTEGYPSAWHIAANEGGFATQGTRLTMGLTGVPSNIVVYAANVITVTPTGGTPTVLTLVFGAGTDGTGGTITGGATTATLISGTSITYEVTTDDDSSATVAIVPIQFYTTGTSTTGTISVSATLSPTSTVGTSSSGAPLPRFAAGTASGTATSVIGCVTNILFPFVTNQFGFNTGFSIANTTTDPFGTSSQSGTCVYNFYGTNAPSGGTFTTASISGGASDTQLLSTIAPNFQGYIIVQCNFQLGHGFFFIQNGFGGGTPNVAQGGPGLIVPQPGTTSSTSRKGFASAGPPFGEGLGH
jgi:hypothetical protein